MELCGDNDTDDGRSSQQADTWQSSLARSNGQHLLSPALHSTTECGEHS